VLSLPCVPTSGSSVSLHELRDKGCPSLGKYAQITAQSFRNDIPRRTRPPRLSSSFFCEFHCARKLRRDIAISPNRPIARFSPPSSIYKLTKSLRLVQLYDHDPVPIATMSSSPEPSSQELSDSPCSSRSASPKPLSLQVRDFTPHLCLPFFAP
jgi:hypothetical protein